MDSKSSRSKRPQGPSYKKKRKFSGNRFTSVVNTSGTSALSEKLKRSLDFTMIVDETVHYSILNLFVFTTLTDILICENCKSDVSILKPIYENLISEDLLERCVGTNTQQQREL